MVLTIVIVVVLWIASNVAVFAFAVRRGRRLAEADAERLLRIDPPRRTAGAPTNVDSEPSSPRKPRWRSGTFQAGPPHQ